MFWWAPAEYFTTNKLCFFKSPEKSIHRPRSPDLQAVLIPTTGGKFTEPPQQKDQHQIRKTFWKPQRDH